MGKEQKSSWKIYSAWNYEKEVEDLNKASEEGWQMVRTGLFHRKFVRNPNVRYRYQMDFGRIDDMGRYIETFREQGWEYVNSTYNKWHYFRKAYDPSLPEDAYEIFTDRESLREMHNRWGRLALIISILLAGFAVFYCVQLLRTPQLPLLIQTLAFALESGLLLRGWAIMRNPNSNRSRKRDSAIVTAILAVIILGATAAVILSGMRPKFKTAQGAASLEAPIVDSRWNEFTVKYRDNYFLDLDMRADRPMTFSILNENGEPVFTRTETNFHQENILLTLPVGTYSLSMSSETGFNLDMSIE
jgi:hypothetical protein